MKFALSLAVLAGTASASFAVREEINPDLGFAKVVNRCPYDVYLWSIDKEMGCSSGSTKKLSKGGSHTEQFRNGTNGGISIKISKWNQCGGKDQTQLEYKIVYPGQGAPPGNYLDMSFVDCRGGDCPGWKEGFYMGAGKSGHVSIQQASTVNNERCPEFMVANPAEAAKVSYVLPDDRQTKWCQAKSNLDLYLCGSEKPDFSDESAPSAAPSSSKIAAPSQPQPSSFQVLPSKPAAAPSKSADDVKVKAAEVTAAPKAPAPEAPKNVKTVITYVTVSVDAPQKRHAHGRRHNHRA